MGGGEGERAAARGVNKLVVAHGGLNIHRVSVPLFPKRMLELDVPKISKICRKRGVENVKSIKSKAYSFGLEKNIQRVLGIHPILDNDGLQVTLHISFP